jgi:iron complex transport system substrate-binding protein
MKSFLIGLVLLLLVMPLSAQETVTCEAGFSLFDHELLATDPVCVPENPQRIATLDPFSLEMMMAADRLPVAAVNVSASLTRLPELVDRLAEVVDLGQPASLEILLAEQPDLILTVSGAYDEVLSQLNEIAPVVVIQFEYSGQWKEVTQAFAEVIGAEAEIEAVFESYDMRAAALNELLGEEPPVVSVVRILPDAINLYMRESFPGTVLADSGITQPESQDYSAEEAIELFDNPIQYTISRENLRDADADIIITWSFGATEELREAAQEQRETLLNDPLWSALEAVQSERMYQGGPYWIGSGIYAAHRILDDLFLYVAEVDPAEVAPNPLTEAASATEVAPATEEAIG